MSLANTALRFNIALLGTPIVEGVATGPAAAQATALPVVAEAVSVLASAANGSLIMKSIKSGEASTMVFVINDSPNSIQVFCASGENMNGVANAQLTIPTGQSGLFVMVPNKLGGPDWRANVIA